MKKLKVKSAGQCSFKLSGFYLCSLGSLSKARKLIPGFLFFKMEIYTNITGGII